MKKVIQICSLFSLLVIFGVAAASANAQSSYGADVNIPFAFNIGSESYEAGNYILKVSRSTNGTATLSIQHPKTNVIRTVLMNGSGDASDGQIKLVFDIVGGQRYLTKVSTPLQTYAILKWRSDVNKSRDEEKDSESAMIGGSANLF